MQKIAITAIMLFLIGCEHKANDGLQDNVQAINETSTSDAITPLKVSDNVQTCATAMLNTKIKFKEWKKSITQSCASLNEEEQKLASEKATELSGIYTDGDITLPRIKFGETPSDAIIEFEEGSLPYTVKPLSEEEEWLALQGNYQAQRNYAYSMSQTNPIAGCAWRIVIIKLGHKRVDTTDTDNLKVYCGKLDTIELNAAEIQAQQLLKTISTNVTK